MELSWSDVEATLRVEEVLDDLGIELVKQTRSGWQNTPCPLPSHPGSDTSPSFGVNADRRRFKCFTCDASGTLANLVEQIEGLSYDDALAYLVQFSDAETDTDEAHVAQLERIYENVEARQNQKHARTLTMPYFKPTTLDRVALAPLELLAKWQIRDPQTIAKFGIRFDATHTRGGYVGPALIIPHMFGGELVGWQERWLDEDRPKDLPKYTNTSDFPREETIYNFDLATEMTAEGEPVVAVESVMTVGRLYELGIAAVATFGASVNYLQLRLLSTFKNVVLAYDNDDAGRKSQRELAEYLTDFTAVDVLAFSADEKSDLADLPDVQVLHLMKERLSALED